ncbi:hypothetical protein [Natronomonas sp. LN261]|jgi:hypothetical protein|uniref:hypothetical protein n=1 Tax=Natronomonas sp. LN261 TaxID=2750669 RepID=UPI0015EE4245|nr:hypothetical protein [Natronomonas sp. LN261]
MGNDEIDLGGAFPDGFVVPITGLLAFLFAVLAGASAYPAISGSWGVDAVALPIVFIAASLVCLRLRSKYRGGRDGE